MAYVCFAVLIISGITMTLLSRNYEGAGNLNSSWAQVMTIKHIVVLLMICIGIYMGEVNAKKIGKLMAGGPGPDGPPPDFAKLEKLQLNLAKLNLVLGVLVLLLTGICTAITAGY